jgi:hypothetical protein
MPYLIQYQYSYKQKIGASAQTVTVTLYRTSSLAGSGTPVVTNLIASAEPFTVSIIDNDKNKFTPIRGKQAVLKFKPQPGLTAATFSSGPDDEWLVFAQTQSGYILFQGFLVMDDHQQAFLPVEHQYDIELTATDNLGTLKEVPLTDDSGNYIRGYKRMIDVIAQCLRKTNLQIEIVYCDSWMEESQTTFDPACNVVFMEMKTFEKKIGEAVSCYEALEIIFGYRLTIMQKNGAWWIENIDEKTGNPMYRFAFDYMGTYTGNLPIATFNQTIGKTQELKFINKDAILSFTRPEKSVKLTYEYNYPIEIIDNIDFSRGGLFLPLSMPPVMIDGVTYYQSKYHIDDWLSLQVPTGVIGGTPSASTTNSYIRRLFVDSTKTLEKERCAVIEAHSPAKGYYIQSNLIPVIKNDKFDISVDVRYSNDGAFPGSGFIGSIRCRSGYMATMELIMCFTAVQVEAAAILYLSGL